MGSDPVSSREPMAASKTLKDNLKKPQNNNAAGQLTRQLFYTRQNTRLFESLTRIPLSVYNITVSISVNNLSFIALWTIK